MVPVEKFRVEGGALVVVCPSCGAEGRSGAPSRPPPFSVVEGEGRPSVADSLVPPPGRCPKCIAARDDDALSCARCGLVFANANEADLTPPDELKSRWEALVGQWSDPAEHDGLLRYAASVGQLAPLARLYRIWTVRSPTDARAQKALESILTLVATASLVPAKRVEQNGRRLLLVLATLLVLVALGLIAALWMKYGPLR